MFVRRTAAVLAATAVIGAVVAPAASAAGSSPSPSPSAALPSGLFGTADPTYDGVWRQSLALLAQHTVGQSPASSAVGWLTGQQCANGAFAAYRADASAACDAKTQIDTNSTAAAVQALGALGGHDDATGKAVAWLKSVQNKDGGWGYMAGGPSDTNSTSVVIGALKAVGEKPASVTKDGKSPTDALLKLSTACDAEGDGAFAYQPDKKGKLAANADATAAGVTAGMGQGFAAEPGNTFALTGCHIADKPDLADAAANGAEYLVKTMAKTSYLKSALPGAADQPDYGNTADAVVALSAIGATKEAKKPLAWLEKNSADWAAKSGPAAYAQLIFAAHTSGTDPRHFGGEDLVARLAATGPAPVAAGATASPSEKKNDEKKDDGNGLGVWWIVGIGLVAGIGIGFLLSGRNKKQQL
ncbi:prenyltransferase/squalene oxidase repeat-containing protein [Streptomyces aureus]|uniref:prenyltransferase/squalene oxidase repeat-containing protein n=1 Tax=Streptomyces aureus TaxID=193461 RepID=UPI00056931F1|nr:prenyltransferase/squalene oxidase repeat-containing protein [Streptomyces aureus]